MKRGANETAGLGTQNSRDALKNTHAGKLYYMIKNII
jgi:hypothetical protein